MALSLTQNLQQSKVTLEEFKDIAIRVLEYMPAVIDNEVEYRDYLLCSSTIAGSTKHIRPFKKDLFLRQNRDFIAAFEEFRHIVRTLHDGERDFQQDSFTLVDRVVYTIQQAIGIGLDLLVSPNSSRKHVGTRFEELIRAVLSAIGIPIKKVVLSIPYDTGDGQKYYRCETDVIISPFEEVRSSAQTIHPQEVVISLKTTTKDRMPKIFIDKILMERFVGHPVKVVGISLNDVQRKDDTGASKISYTFVSNLFMVYTTFLAQLEGYYYLDIPQRASTSPFNQYIFPFSQFVLEDVWNLLSRS